MTIPYYANLAIAGASVSHGHISSVLIIKTFDQIETFHILKLLEFKVKRS